MDKAGAETGIEVKNDQIEHHKDEKLQPTHGHNIAPLPYSLFTTKQKKWIVAIAASAGWFSTASSFAYFPAIPFLAKDLNVSVNLINLTVTSYLITSGVFPSITGAAADRYGRRIVLLVSLALYVAINVGLALQLSFAGLFVLRMVQSAAISGILLWVFELINSLI
jgi:MFS family permease